MSTPTPLPLYPVREQIADFLPEHCPELSDYFSRSDQWKRKAWSHGREYLAYIGRNKSPQTYSRFRTEVEKFLIWSFLIRDESMLEYTTRQPFLDYADFCWRPPQEWITLQACDRFQIHGDVYSVNPAWAPFRLRMAKGDASEPNKKNYRPSQQTLIGTFTALNAFYEYLVEQGFCAGNHVRGAKKDCRHFIKDSQVKQVKRLSESQWQFLLNVAIKMADEDPRFERNLFLIASLKSLFLRISELSERDDWIPTMNHFWKDHEEIWWFKVFGKGRKLRDVAVPDSFLPYLRRYRVSRSLSTLPTSDDQNHIIEKARGHGGLTSRQLSRLVQDVFDKAYELMADAKGVEEAQRFREITTHWLRHTGASLDVEHGRELREVSEDLGHATTTITDSIYVQSDVRKRGRSGKARPM